MEKCRQDYWTDVCNMQRTSLYKNVNMSRFLQISLLFNFLFGCDTWLTSLFTWVAWLYDSIVYDVFQRWNRGHKARGQDQGLKKNPRPRPRTALPRTDPLEAKDRNARGQGQGPQTQAQVFSKNKVLKIVF